MLNLYALNRCALYHTGGWWETLRWSALTVGVAVEPDLSDVVGENKPRAMAGVRFAFPPSAHSVNPWSHFGLTTGVAFRNAGEKTPVAVLDYRY